MRLLVLVFIGAALIAIILSTLKERREEKKMTELKATNKETVDQEEIVAAITAALAAHLGKKYDDLLIASIRPIENGSNWRQAGRMRSMEKRLTAQYLIRRK